MGAVEVGDHGLGVRLDGDDLQWMCWWLVVGRTDSEWTLVDDGAIQNG